MRSLSILKSKFLQYLGIISLLLLGACIRKDDMPALEKGDGQVDFTLLVPKSDSGPTTYALSASNENQVSDVSILLFNASGKFSHIAQTQAISSSGTNGEVKSFSVKLPMGITVDLVLLTNAQTWVRQAFPNGIPVGMAKEELLSELTMEQSDKWISDPSDPVYKPIPMWAEKQGVSLTESVRFTGENAFQLVRSLARVDVTLTTPEARNDFNLQHVYVYNAYRKGQLVPIGDAAHWDAANNRVLLPSLPIGAAPASDPLVYSGAEISILNAASTAEIYLMEASKATVGSLNDATCLVVGGQYKDGGTYYYRVDFAQEDVITEAITYLDILRNYHYKINISQVSGPGASSPEAALAARSVPIQTEVQAWNYAEMSDVVIEGPYNLSVSESSVNLTQEETMSGIVVTSNYRGGGPRWTAESSNPAWLTIEPGSESATSEQSIMIYQAAKNSTGTTRQATLTLRAGNIVKKITITQQATPYNLSISNPSNCYIVAPGSAGVRFPVNRANQDGNQRIVNTFQIKPLWTDNKEGLSLHGAYHRVLKVGEGPTGSIIVIPGTAAGNVLLAAEENGQIRWSWHIWVTPYQPNTGVQPINNGFTFMDRNLGALSATLGDAHALGLVYQWGRKDPFPGIGEILTTTAKRIYSKRGVLLDEGAPAGIRAVPVTVTNNLENAITDPMMFFINPNPPGDWYTNEGVGNSSKNNYLWNSVANMKTVYDPCPEGWRVPRAGDGPASPWYNLPAQRFGLGTGMNWNAEGAGVYPAAGARTGLEFTMTAGIQGNYWGANPAGLHGDYAINMHFNTADSALLIPNNVMSRYYGTSVRCVRE